MIGKKILGILALALAVALASRMAFFSHTKSAVSERPLDPQGTPLLASLQQPANVPAPSVAPKAAPPVALPPVGERRPGQNSANDNDGKTVLVADGKTVLPPDGKESLPPVGEMVGQHMDAVNPLRGEPPVEYLNKNNSSSNPLLNPPNPVNVSGPVVSAETRSPP